MMDDTFTLDKEKNALYLKLAVDEAVDSDTIKKRIETYVANDTFENVLIDISEYDYPSSKDRFNLFKAMNDLTGLLNNHQIENRVIISDDYLLNCKLFEQIMINSTEYRKIHFSDSIEDAMENFVRI